MPDDDLGRAIAEALAESLDKAFSEDDVRAFKRLTTPSWVFGWHPLRPATCFDIGRPIELIGYWKRRDCILFEIRQGLQIHPGNPKFVWFATADTAVLRNPKAENVPPHYFGTEADARDACDAVDATQVDGFLLYPRSGDLRCDDDNA